MKKYSFKLLAVELTRQCNKHCEHCINGEPQDITITPAIIDRIFEDVGDCEQVTIVGGEPTLNIEILSYLVNSILKSDWSTIALSLTTNGKILDSRVIDVLDRFCCRDRFSNRMALLRISNDCFHDSAEYTVALNFYQELVKEKPWITVKYVGELNESLVNMGRAKSLFANQSEMLAKYFPITPTLYSHQIKIVDGVIYCGMHISANGKVGIDEPWDFSTADALSFGNILISPLNDLIKKNNSSSLLSCNDLNSLFLSRNWEKFYFTSLKSNFGPIPGFIDSVLARISNVFLERTLRLRQNVHEMYPFVPVQDIIRLLPMPDNIFKFANKKLLSIYNSGSVNDDDMKKYVDTETLSAYQSSAGESSEFEKQYLLGLISALTLLMKHQENGANPNRIFDDPSEAFRKFEILNRQYQSGKKVKGYDFPCKMDDNIMEKHAGNFAIRDGDKIRCSHCRKVIQSCGRNIHCVEKPDGLECDYCGAKNIFEKFDWR